MTADTSVVVAALSRWHDEHDAATTALEGISALPAQALTEAYSVLTRLPGGLSVDGDAAARVLAARFPDAPLQLAAAAGRTLRATLARAGVSAGATYDGLIALEAKAHGHTLLTLDARARETYRRLVAPSHAVIA